MALPMPDTSTIEERYFKEMGRAYVEYVGPCPWNPFPRTSPWGQKIDEIYRRSVARRRALQGSMGDE